MYFWDPTTRNISEDLFLQRLDVENNIGIIDNEK